MLLSRGLCSTIQASAMVILFNDTINAHILSHGKTTEQTRIQHITPLSALSTKHAGGSSCYSLPLISTLLNLFKNNQLYAVVHICLQLVTKIHEKYNLKVNRNINNLTMLSFVPMFRQKFHKKLFEKNAKQV